MSTIKESCPFCLSWNVSIVPSKYPYVSCNECGAEGPMPEDSTPQDRAVERAIERWNTRKGGCDVKDSE